MVRSKSITNTQNKLRLKQNTTFKTAKGIKKELLLDEKNNYVTPAMNRDIIYRMQDTMSFHNWVEKMIDDFQKKMSKNKGDGKLANNFRNIINMIGVFDNAYEE